MGGPAPLQQAGLVCVAPKLDSVQRWEKGRLVVLPGSESSSLVWTLPGRVQPLTSARVWCRREPRGKGASSPAPSSLVALGVLNADRRHRLAAARWTVERRTRHSGLWKTPGPHSRSSYAQRMDDPRATTVAEWAHDWLRDNTGDLKPKTIASYRSLVRSVIVPTLGDRPLGELTRAEIQTWVRQVRADLSPSRTRQAYRLLSQMLSLAELDELIARSPCRSIRLPRLPTHDPVILSAEEVAALVAALSAPDDLFVLTLAYTGLRFGEGAALQRRRIDVPARTLLVAASLSEANGHVSMEEPKTHQRRLVTLPASLAERLGTHLESHVKPEPEAWVFTSPQGFPLRHPNFMRRVWHPASATAEIKATPHDLRATHASRLYDQGWSPVEIAARLGHDRATVTTKHYARSITGRDVEIAERLDQQLRTG